MAEINELDLAFIVDTTGSMGGLIQSAQQQMISMMRELLKAAEVDMRLGVVEYRDHPPQDKLVVRAYPFTDNLDKAQKAINGLKADGGGDGPESVFDGIITACRELKWREHARRIAVLVGDAPPHGVGAGGDGFKDGCPCGETIDSVTRTAEEARVTLYAMGLTRDKVMIDSFTLLSQMTGGEFFEAGKGSDAIERLKAILASEFGNLEYDRHVLDLYEANPEASIDDLAAHLQSSRPAVSAALSRLGTRGLLNGHQRSFEQAGS
jgi:Mg-chelatase subunit ChlD